MTVSPDDPASSFSAPSVTRKGTVYFVQDDVSTCGSARLVRAPVKGPSGAVFTFPAGIEVLSTWAVTTRKKTTVYYTRVRCDSDNYDLYKLVDVGGP